MAATLVVEDGTGLATANSYITAATGNSHMEELYLLIGLAAAPTLTDIDCISGSLYLDAEFGTVWPGLRINKDQGLDFPRLGILFDKGEFEYDSDEVPKGIEQAAAIMAYYAQTVSGGIMPNQSDSGEVKRIKKKAGPIEKEVEYVGGNPVEVYYRLAENILRSAQLLRQPGEVRRA